MFPYGLTSWLAGWLIEKQYNSHFIFIASSEIEILIVPCVFKGSRNSVVAAWTKPFLNLAPINIHNSMNNYFQLDLTQNASRITSPESRKEG